MSGLFGIAAGVPGAGRARYARAMGLYFDGRLTAEQLEAYRTAAADDSAPPEAELRARGLPVPDDSGPAPHQALAALVDESDRYLATLPGPGVAEVRAGLAAWRDGPATPAEPAPNAVRDAHLPAALAALAPSHPALAQAIAAAAPHLRWITYDLYDPALIGPHFARGHAYASILGEAGAIPARDYDLGLFVIAPHVFYRDHHHPAPELYAPLTGPHGWRFGAGRPLVTKPAHVPVWNPPNRPHATKAGATPFLCLFGWTRDVNQPAQVIPADDWPQLEALRLD